MRLLTHLFYALLRQVCGRSGNDRHVDGVESEIGSEMRVYDSRRERQSSSEGTGDESKKKRTPD